MSYPYHEDLSFVKTQTYLGSHITPVKIETGIVKRTKRTETIEWQNSKPQVDGKVTCLFVNEMTKIYLVNYEGEWYTLHKTRGYRGTYEISGGTVVKFCK